MRNEAGIRDQNDIDSVFAGGGRMGALMRSMDWSRTPLGPVSRESSGNRSSREKCKRGAATNCSSGSRLLKYPQSCVYRPESAAILFR